MTLANLIDTEVLGSFAGDNKGKDHYLRRVFGLQDDDFAEIRRLRGLSGRVFDRCYAMAEVLKARLETRVKEGEDIVLSSQFTLYSSAALLNGTWDNPFGMATNLGGVVRRHYKDEKKKLHEETGLRIPAPHLFRNKLGVYTGNLIEAKKRWPMLQVSHEDWLDSIQIPLEMDADLAFLLGVVWADGSYSSKAKGIAHITLSGSDDDHTFYERTVVPLLHTLFNKRAIVSTAEKADTSMLGFTSKAATTFLQYHWGFPQKKKDYTVPSFDSSFDSPEQVMKMEKAFFSGLMAGMGVPYAYSRNGRTDEFWVRLFDDDLMFMRSVYALTQRLGLNGKYLEEKDRRQERLTGKLSFYGDNAVELYRQGYMVNPKHYHHPFGMKVIASR